MFIRKVSRLYDIKLKIYGSYYLLNIYNFKNVGTMYLQYISKIISVSYKHTRVNILVGGWMLIFNHCNVYCGCLNNVYDIGY